MGFRFFRRIRIAPGVTLNLSKSGLSTSFGPRGAKFTVGPRGTRQTVGIPGTGLFYTTTQSYNKKQPPRTQAPTTPAQSLNIGFFKSLVIPADEKSFVEGCKALLQNDLQAAHAHFAQSGSADACFMAGVIALKLDMTADAEQRLQTALQRKESLGALLNKYGIEAGASIPITDEISAFVQADAKGALLILTEVYQERKNFDAALNCLFDLRKFDPEDILVKLSLIEIYFETFESDKNRLQSILNLSNGIENLSAIHTAILLYRASALRVLGLNEAARDILTGALRKRKDRSVDLLHAIQYERALVYENLGKPQLARKDFEKIFAVNPEFEDVAKRLGLS